MSRIYGLAVAALGFAAAGFTSCTIISDDDEHHRHDRSRELAPIEEAVLIVRDTFPQEYAVRIVSGLPGGCTTFDHIDVERTGTLVEITVWNLVRTEPGIACTMIYRTTEHTVELGSNFFPGRTYHVVINDEVALSFGTQ